MPKGVLALNVNGDLTYCTCSPDQRGVGRCNHVDHQGQNESVEEFIERVSVKMVSEDGVGLNDGKQVDAIAEPISQQEVDQLAEKMDEIVGCHLTAENLKEVMARLSPEQMGKLSQIGFQAAPVFSLPIRDEEYEDQNVKNKLYFATLPNYGVAGSKSAVQQMFEKVGMTPVHGGQMQDIEHSYEQGLTPGEYFAKNYYARKAMIVKGLDTAKPGWTARKLFYALSDTQAMADCGGPYIDAMHCNLPNGHVCVHCAHATAGGEGVKEGGLVGGLVSTRLSEGLTQASMEMKHTGTTQSLDKQKSADIIMSTLDGWGTSPIIQRMQEVKTTEERRQILYDLLKEQYEAANLKMDEFNLQMVARKMTSYKRDVGGLRPVEPDECCDIVSLGVVGNSNNIFKSAELSAGYRQLTNPLEQELGKDAANQILN